MARTPKGVRIRVTDEEDRSGPLLQPWEEEDDDEEEDEESPFPSPRPGSQQRQRRRSKSPRRGDSDYELDAGLLSARPLHPPPTPRVRASKQMKVFTSLDDLSEAIQRKKTKQRQRRQPSPQRLHSAVPVSPQLGTSPPTSTPHLALPRFKHEVVLYNMDFTKPEIPMPDATADATPIPIPRSASAAAAKATTPGTATYAEAPKMLTPMRKDGKEGKTPEPSAQSEAERLLSSFDLNGAYLVGNVKLPEGVTEKDLIDRGAVIIKPKFDDIPFNPFRTHLYTVEELRTVDAKIAQWVSLRMPTIFPPPSPTSSRPTGSFSPSIREKVMMDLHDSQMYSALRKFVRGRFVVGVMGGHTMSRGDKMYASIAVLCQRIARKDFIVVSGGGPGAMEAANLGAYFSVYNEEQLLDAIAMLQKNGSSISPEWNNTEVLEEVLAKYNRPDAGANSLAVPTYHFGTVPFTRFAPLQAKFISSAVRDDILMHICNCGFIFAPGAAGTRTQIYQYAVPNAYAAETKDDFSKPMIFFGVFWLESGFFQSFLNVAQKEDAQKNRTLGYSSKVHCVEHPTQVLQILSSFKKRYYDQEPPGLPAIGEKVGSEESESPLERAKRLAAQLAVDTLVTGPDIRVGVGSGSTIKYVVDRLSSLAIEKGWNITCVPASISTRELLRKRKGLTVRSLLEISHVNVVIDGTNELDIVLNQIKGSGGALLQEKVLAASADQFVIVADERKDSLTLGSRGVPVPIEVQTLAYKRVKRALVKTYGIEVHLRKSGQAQQGPFVTDNSNLILDAHFNSNHLRDPVQLENALKKIPGILEVGLFCGLVSKAFVGNRNGTVHERVRAHSRETALTAISNETQQRTLQEVIQTVKKTENAVVEVRLSVALAPFERTIRALQRVGVAYNIDELQDPQKYLSLLPGSTLGAWNAWIDDTVRPTQMLEKYPKLLWKAEKPENAWVEFGQPGATVWSTFNLALWNSNGLLVQDIPVAGLAMFEWKVREAGGTVVFTCDNRTYEHLEATTESLKKSGIPHDHLHIELADESRSADEQLKELQERITKGYGTIVAIFDDSQETLLQVEKNNPSILPVAMAIPGFSCAPFVSSSAKAAASFELDQRDSPDESTEVNSLFEFVETSRVRNRLARNIVVQPRFSDESLRMAKPIEKPLVNFIRVGTFNVENLFSRFEFKGKNRDHTWSLKEVRRTIADDDIKHITALAIKKLNADILALQEVEDALTLDLFVKELLPDCGYEHRFLIEGNDPRGIDVAIISRFPVVHLRSYRHEKNQRGDPLFSRDCLEAKVEVPSGAHLTFYINHFKSMVGSRENTDRRREEQVARVLQILRKNHGETITDAVVVLGDFNDYIDDSEEEPSSIAPLVRHKDFENVLDRLPVQERWTHYWKDEDEYKQLDYLLFSKSLANTNPTGLPIVVREGQPARAARFTGKRFPGVGVDGPKASDHCPIAFDVAI